MGKQWMAIHRAMNNEKDIKEEYLYTGEFDETNMVFISKGIAIPICGDLIEDDESENLEFVGYFGDGGIIIYIIGDGCKD